MTDKPDEFDLPPRQSMPTDARGRVRATVTAGLNRAPRRHPRAPLAAAAGVAVLAAGAVVAGSALGGDSGPQPLEPGPEQVETGPEPLEPGPEPARPGQAGDVPQPPSADPEKILDRCWAAVVEQGRTDDFPDRSLWEPVTLLDNLDPGNSFGKDYDKVTTVAARADGAPLFCQTTGTTVSISDPNAAPAYLDGTETAALLFTDARTLAGVVDPGWDKTFVTWYYDPTTDDQHYARVKVKDGLFVASGLTDPGDAKQTAVAMSATIGEGSVWRQPQLPAPALSVVDQPVDPPPDRSSERGQYLAECLSNAETPVVDPDGWQPGAAFTADDKELPGTQHYLIARHLDDRVAICAPWIEHEGTLLYDFVVDVRGRPIPGPSKPPVLLHWATSFGDLPMVYGSVSNQAAEMELTLRNQSTVAADVANATFAAPLPPGVLIDNNSDTHPDEGVEQPGEIVSVRVTDADGQLLYEGPIDS